jgi:hypothetical protein
VPRGVEDEVLGLEVPVDDAAGVEVVEGAGDLGGVEAGALLPELAALGEVVVELAAVEEVWEAKEKGRREAGGVGWCEVRFWVFWSRRRGRTKGG